ncbi:MAG: 4Fe-4S dicluster domain-containing protein [Proteobacteria bacterium]|nr:4Fe-4S dicluster domain-containing protein [Pseudomonadota bacterium]
MKQVSIKTNFDLCTGCLICQLECSAWLFGSYNPHRAALNIDHANENLYHFPIVCNHCENTYCATVCPTQAISRNEGTGAIVVDPEKCIGCKNELCSQYCPIKVIHVDPESKKAIKCDLCGGSPRCVSSCPTGALELATGIDVPADKGDL